MPDTITTSDKAYIEMLCHQFYDKFHNTSPEEIALEVRVDNQIYTNPTLIKVQELHQQYKTLKITYRVGE